MRVVWGHDQAVAAWVAQRIPGCSRGFGACRAMGVTTDRETDLVAGAVFHDWNPETGTIEMSAAATDKRWLQSNVLLAMFSYPFDGIGCQMVAMRVSGRNHQGNGRGLPRIFKAYGFQSVRIPRLYGRDEDGILFTLTDDAWRSNGFHKEHHHGQA